ncbi:sensor histidine kinase [Streptomyces sp. TS71-3]|uniref:sensor histidine kinase n=1 Tax=Streptomyces sp. TS71-3 TaxID=2733862 RepID=UPI001B15D7EA|nr:sensor histidine kinase [Streptomyces sp. TS71-3]GHJ37965.1 two-component sensor histidine kinase [Streptomyces sp. TS71-3]
MSWKNDMTSAARSAAAGVKAAGRLRRRRERRAWGGDGQPGPPNGFALLPWLLVGLGSVSSLVHGGTPLPWLAGLGLAVFNSLYSVVVFRAFDKAKREARCTRWMLAVMAVAAFGLAAGYGGSWLVFLPLLALAGGAVLRGRAMARVVFGITVLAGATAAVRIGWDAIEYAYGTFISGMVTAAILALSETVKELRATREELARTAVERERLRFSRDLHDLLGHTLSVVVVKAEAARRVAPRDLDAALAHVTDIESVGRQALTEIREAVTGYREGSLSTELDRARSALGAAGVEPVVTRSGPPLTAQQEALLGWVVREAVTNVVRHSRADRCEITVAGSGERLRLGVLDNGRGPAAAVVPDGTTGRTVGGTGLKGLTERLAAAGGSLTAGRGPRGGFLVTAELPVEPASDPAPAAGRDPGTGVILKA